MEFLKMAVGDIINFNGDSASSYQPAAGIEIMVLMIYINNTAMWWGMTDGTTVTRNYSNDYGKNTFTKYGITNTQYFYLDAIRTATGFSGLQIK